MDTIIITIIIIIDIISGVECVRDDRVSTLVIVKYYTIYILHYNIDRLNTRKI